MLTILPDQLPDEVLDMLCEDDRHDAERIVRILGPILRSQGYQVPDALCWHEDLVTSGAISTDR